MAVVVVAVVPVQIRTRTRAARRSCLRAGFAAAAATKVVQGRHLTFVSTGAQESLMLASEFDDGTLRVSCCLERADERALAGLHQSARHPDRRASAARGRGASIQGISGRYSCFRAISILRGPRLRTRPQVSGSDQGTLTCDDTSTLALRLHCPGGRTRSHAIYTAQRHRTPQATQPHT